MVFRQKVCGVRREVGTGHCPYVPWDQDQAMLPQNGDDRQARDPHGNDAAPF